MLMFLLHCLIFNVIVVGILDFLQISLFYQYTVWACLSIRYHSISRFILIFLLVPFVLLTRTVVSLQLSVHSDTLSSNNLNSRYRIACVEKCRTESRVCCEWPHELLNIPLIAPKCFLIERYGSTLDFTVNTVTTVTFGTSLL